MQKTNEQILFTDAMLGIESIQLSAVAGSGKTTTLLMGLAEAVRAGLRPEDILLLSFNAKIKEELAKKAPEGTNVLTLNGLGHRAWGKQIGSKLILDSKKVGSIVSELCRDPRDPDRHAYLQSLWADVKDLVCKAKAVGLLPRQFTTGKALVEDTDQNWQALSDLHSIAFSDDILKLARSALVLSTQAALKGNIDFDDQLFMPAVFRASLNKYKLVLVDEAQDLSEIQHFLISRAVATGGRLISVGDPHQAIYGFRGAKADSMAALGEKFECKVLALTQSFRCSKAAIKVAQSFVPHITAFEGNLPGSVVRLGMKWNPKQIEDGATVLCRNIAPLVKLGMQCIKEGIPAYVAGRDIGAPLIKAVKALNPVQELSAAILDWSTTERIKAKDNLELLSRIEDTTEALFAVMEVSSCRDAFHLGETLKALFARTTGSIILSTIHRAKGLQWDTVYILDAWRMPQKWIEKAVKDSPDAAWMLEQEKNLFYIAVTRTKDKLIFIDYKEEDMNYVF